MSARRIIVNGFKAPMLSHTTAGLWRHPDNRAPGFMGLDYWVQRARTLESYGFDALFIADSLGTADTYRHCADQALIEGLQTPQIDP
ncbi:MAG: 5,10-methylene tetrahydromethanopterin reductase, partial [Microbacterium sp.]